MKKINKILLSILPVATVATTAIAVTSCNNTSVLGYDEAKVWIGKNYGTDAAAWVKPKKATTELNFGGELAANGGNRVETYLNGTDGYWPTHLASLIEQFGYFQQGSLGLYSTFYSHQNQSYTFRANLDAKDGDLEFTDVNFFAPLTAANFDDYMSCYFAGSSGKRSTKFVVEGKTLKMVGTLQTYTQGTGGINAFTMPDFTLSFDEQGKMVEASFTFTKYAEAEYIWYADAKANRDWFDLALNEGGTIKFAYTYN